MRRAAPWFSKVLFVPFVPFVSFVPFVLKNLMLRSARIFGIVTRITPNAVTWRKPTIENTV